MNGQHTYFEITSQPEAWQDALDAFDRLASDIRAAWEAAGAEQLIFAGCGSTHYLSQTAASLFQTLTGAPARAYPSSELLLYPERTLRDARNTLLVTISRSGTTTETIEALYQFRARNGRSAWTITCDPNSPLAQASDLVMAAESAQEESVAQTRSFASMLLLAQALAATLGGYDTEPLWQLPAIGRQILATTEPLMRDIGRRSDLKQLYFLGSGYQFGVASEMMLKMTEMTLTPSQAFHPMEFRHGPMSMATEEALITGLLSPKAFTNERKVLAEMARMGAHTLAINPTTAPAQTEWCVTLPAELPEWAYPLLHLPALQLLAYHRAVHKGLDPDRPRNLEAVVYLDAVALR